MSSKRNEVGLKINRSVEIQSLRPAFLWNWTYPRINRRTQTQIREYRVREFNFSSWLPPPFYWRHREVLIINKRIHKTLEIALITRRGQCTRSSRPLYDAGLVLRMQWNTNSGCMRAIISLQSLGRTAYKLLLSSSAVFFLFVHALGPFLIFCRVGHDVCFLANAACSQGFWSRIGLVW